jgi:hypothetical protein
MIHRLRRTIFLGCAFLVGAVELLALVRAHLRDMLHPVDAQSS